MENTEGNKIIKEIMTTTTTISSPTAIGSSSAAYNNFLFSIKSEATKRLYIYCLNKYMRYHHFDNVEDLLTKQKEQSPRLIEADIIQYIVWLKQDQQLSSISVELYFSSIMRFFSMNDIILNRKKIGMYIGEYTRTQKDRAYSTEEIHKLLDFSDERSKALILLLASTGLRIGAVADLQLRHLKKISQYQLYHIIVYEGTREEYFTFTTPEASTAIDIYLDYRKRYGEKLNDNSPLFREQFDVNDLLAIKYHPKKMMTRGLTKLLVRQLNRSGVMPASKETEDTRRGKKRNVVARCHGFRKFTTTNMIRAKVNPEAREMLLGHSIGLNNAYYRPGEDEILSEYLKAVDLLTINEENRLKVKVKTLESEKDTKIAQLQSEVDKSRQLFEQIFSRMQQMEDLTQRSINLTHKARERFGS